MNQDYIFGLCQAHIVLKWLVYQTCPKHASFGRYPRYDFPGVVIAKVGLGVIYSEAELPCNAQE